MKNIFFSIIILVAAVISCRSDDETPQIIDQILNIYIDSAGQDMLNNQLSGSYQSVAMNDVNGISDNAPVTVNMLYDVDSLRYIDYIAGARRILVDSSNQNSKIYESEIALIFTKKINDTVTSTFQDTLRLQYVLKPEIFEIQKAWYDGNLVFTKVSGQPNIIKISK